RGTSDGGLADLQAGLRAGDRCMPGRAQHHGGDLSGAGPQRGRGSLLGMTAMSLHTRPEPLPLAGFTVGVTAARRAAELGALLERRGAEVLHAAAIRIVPVADDTELHAATGQLINHPPDIVVITTGIGFR